GIFKSIEDCISALKDHIVENTIMYAATHISNEVATTISNLFMLKRYGYFVEKENDTLDKDVVKIKYIPPEQFIDHIRNYIEKSKNYLKSNLNEMITKSSSENSSIIIDDNFNIEEVLESLKQLEKLNINSYMNFI